MHKTDLIPSPISQRLMKGIIKLRTMPRHHGDFPDHQCAVNKLDVIQELKFAALNARKNNEDSPPCKTSSSMRNIMSFRRVHFADNEKLETDEICKRAAFFSPDSGAIIKLKTSCSVIVSLRSMLAWIFIESFEDAVINCDEIL